MAATTFARTATETIHRWSTSLAVEAAVRQYFRKFMGPGFDNMIRVLKDLSKNKGDKITYTLRMKLSGDGVEDDNVIEGTTAEEALTFYSDYLYIGQRRKGTLTNGRMTEQRVAFNLRKEGRDALAVWMAEDKDQQIMMYLAGIRGIDTSFHVSTAWTGRANNTIAAPDSAHQIYAGDADSAAALDSADVMSLEVIEKCISKAETTDPMIQPFPINGENKFIYLMHTWDQHNLRTNTSTGDWQDLHKNTDNQTSPIYKNALGEYAGVILHKHRNVIRATTTRTRNLFLGAQAGVIAWGGQDIGNGQRNRFNWNEETDDRGNKTAITAGDIYGVKETTFNSKRFGMIACDCYCADPNA